MWRTVVCWSQRWAVAHVEVGPGVVEVGTAPVQGDPRHPGLVGDRRDRQACEPVAVKDPRDGVEHLIINGINHGFQIAASHAIKGVDTQLIDDGTYFVVEAVVEVAGCGGWSNRATLYGGDHTAGRNDDLLDPTVDAARVRAMYTDPRYARQGVGRLLLERCQAAAVAEGFRRLELVATLAGQPLYSRLGFEVVEAITDTSTGVGIPLARMIKTIPAADQRGAA